MKNHQKKLVSNNDIFVFIFKHRNKILLTDGNKYYIPQSFDENSIILNDYEYDLNQTRNIFEYTFSIDGNNIEWNKWENINE